MVLKHKPGEERGKIVETVGTQIRCCIQGLA